MDESSLVITLAPSRLDGKLIIKMEEEVGYARTQFS
jgi:hypothetical protein